MGWLRDLHEDKECAGPIKNESVTYGVNREITEFPENGFIRCRKCGFPMNKYRHPKGKETGNTFTTGSYTVSVTNGWGAMPWGISMWGGGIALHYGDPEVSAGCPFCGTFVYE